MKQTANYNLNKPDATDVVDFEIINENMDIIDAELKKSLKNNVAITIEQGGTGATTVNLARKNLGLGDAAIKGVDTIPTNDSSNLIISGGVKSALDGKVNFSLLGTYVPLVKDTLPNYNTILEWAIDNPNAICCYQGLNKPDGVPSLSASWGFLITTSNGNTEIGINVKHVHDQGNTTYERKIYKKVWCTDWMDVRNADTLDGKHATDFISTSGGNIGGRVSIDKIASTSNDWVQAGLMIQTTNTVGDSEMPRIALHSNGAGVCKQIAGDQKRGGISVLNEDGNSLTAFNCSELRAANVKPSYVQNIAPDNTSSLWFY